MTGYQQILAMNELRYFIPSRLKEHQAVHSNRELYCISVLLITVFLFKYRVFNYIFYAIMSLVPYPCAC